MNLNLSALTQINILDSVYFVPTNVEPEIQHHQKYNEGKGVDAVGVNTKCSPARRD